MNIRVCSGCAAAPPPPSFPLMWWLSRCWPLSPPPLGVFLTFSSRSCAALKRRERCWFILARGAVPSAHHTHITQNTLAWLGVGVGVSFIVSLSLCFFTLTQSLASPACNDDRVGRGVGEIHTKQQRLGCGATCTAHILP